MFNECAFKPRTDDRAATPPEQVRRDSPPSKGYQSSIRPGSPYNTVKWQRLRLEHLRAHPFCVFCLMEGRKSPARVVDHIKPWRGNLDLFWDQSNWQSLCKTCHDSTKKRLENSGVFKGGDATGMPFDPRHNWNAK